MKRLLLVIGVLLVLFGVISLAHPTFSYHEKKEVVKFGPVHATVDEEKPVEIPKAAAIVAALAGLALILLAPRLKP